MRNVFSLIFIEYPPYCCIPPWGETAIVAIPNRSLLNCMLPPSQSTSTLLVGALGGAIESTATRHRVLMKDVTLRLI